MLSCTPWLRHQIKSIWLFTYTDLKTIIFPSTLFAVINAIALVRQHQLAMDAVKIGLRLPLALMWAWVNLLPFNIHNQRDASAIAEDRINKGWRPLPAGRMSVKQAESIMKIMYAVAVLYAACVGGWPQCIALKLLGTWYNDYGGADCHFLIRNFINACGFLCFKTGTLEAMITYPALVRGPQVGPWYLVIAGIVLSTIQTQDMYDQAGDSQRGRQTLPLAVGDSACRHFTAWAMIGWSVFVPWFWSLSIWGSLTQLPLALIIATRTLSKRTIEADKLTFRFWNIWLLLVYCSPLFKTYPLLRV